MLRISAGLGSIHGWLTDEILNVSTCFYFVGQQMTKFIALFLGTLELLSITLKLVNWAKKTQLIFKLFR